MKMLIQDCEGTLTQIEVPFGRTLNLAWFSEGYEKGVWVSAWLFIERQWRPWAGDCLPQPAQPALRV